VSAFDFLIAPDVRAVRDSLDANPEDWEPWYIEGLLFHLTHKASKLHLWTRNRPYALAIHKPNGGTLWGGFAWPGLGISRWALLFAIQRWERKHPAPCEQPTSAALILRGEQ
jgi:hypothetical protein